MPLEVLGRTLGAIVVYDAPPHGHFTPLEHAVLAVLVRHAAHTVTGQSYTESARKHTTIQSFIDLLTL